MGFGFYHFFWKLYHFHFNKAFARLKLFDAILRSFCVFPLFFSTFSLRSLHWRLIATSEYESDDLNGICCLFVVQNILKAPRVCELCVDRIWKDELKCSREYRILSHQYYIFSVTSAMQWIKLIWLAIFTNLNRIARFEYVGHKRRLGKKARENTSSLYEVFLIFVCKEVDAVLCCHRSPI